MATVIDDLGGEPDKSGQHPKEVLREMGVLLDLSQLLEVAKGDIAGGLEKTRDGGLKLGNVIHHRHQNLHHVNVRADGVLLVTLQHSQVDLVHERVEEVLQ